ncbi:MAG: zinc ribbon domain-containing protein [Candidatus Omnitrophica bacterium]|nr:zinc ribbon domain-containing protein [Candidatus Omnitrophota bacterium]
MPTYEYECKNCKERFELFQSMTAEPVKVCPKCKGGVKRLIGAGAGIIFKGNGFYATDYRKGKKPAEDSCPAKGKSESCKSCPANR